MNNLIEQMLSTYSVKTTEDKKNAIKEIMQEIVLCGLSRINFFKNIAFYGGTALRIFYNLDRFSEDLDFSLTETNNDFSLENYLPELEKEISLFGINFKTEIKNKTADSAIKSAFVKGNTKEHILMFYPNDKNAEKITQNEMIKIKFEVDTHPPKYASFEKRYRLLPIPYEIQIYDKKSLFAGKIHAVLCRSWQNRVKGRDLYDYVFYLSQNTPVHLQHLNERLKQSNFINSNLDINDLKSLLIDRFSKINFEDAKRDVLPFISNKSKLDTWCFDFFKSITEHAEF